MTRQIINIGTGPDSYTGDNLRTAFTKVNDNFAQLYVGNVGANTSINVLTANTVSTNGNVNAGNVLVQYQVIASGNVSAPIFIGNGRYLTGVTVSANTGNIAFSNLTISGSVAGNIVLDPAGDGNVSIVSDVIPGANVTYNLGSSTRQWKDLWLSNSTLYLGGFPVTVSNTGVLSVNGSPVTSSYGNANVSVFLPTYSGLLGGTLSTVSQPNITAVGILTSLTATNDITTTSGRFIGNGSSLTAITGANVNGTVANATYAVTAQFVTGLTGANVTTALGYVPLNSNSANTYSNTNVTAFLPTYTGNIAGNIVKNGYSWTFGTDGNLALPASGVLLVSGGITAGPTIASPAPYLSGFSSISAISMSASGNITGNYILGNGSQLTGLPATYGNSNVATFLAAFGSNTVSTTGNITAGNISTGRITLTNGAVIKDTADESVAFGQNAGNTSQGSQAVAIGQNAGANSQGIGAVAIGDSAGFNTQGATAVAVGIGAGQTNQGASAVAIGDVSGYTNQGVNAVAIGKAAGATNQANNTIIINATGNALEQTTANTFTVSPVRNDVANVAQVMFYNTTSKEVTYGNTISVAGNINANQYNFANGAVIRDTVGGAVAFGQNAGNTSQGAGAVAIGGGAGRTTQGIYAVAIGTTAGNTTQGIGAVAIGISAGDTTQGDHAIAIGTNSGSSGQGISAVSIGISAGVTTQGDSAVAIGNSAGFSNQGTYAVAVGSLAGVTNQANNTIIINATGANLNQTTANTFTVAPVRNDVANVAQVMFYNTTSKEVTYGNIINIAGNITGGNISATNHTGTTVSVTGNITAANFFGNGNTLSNVATRFESSWTVPIGNSTQSFTVGANETYYLWVDCNIPNGILAWNATATVTNNNVPVVGAQYAWVYSGGGTPIDFTSIPNQFVGTANTIVRSNVAPSATTNRFDFGINNTSGASQTVRYGWVAIS